MYFVLYLDNINLVIIVLGVYVNINKPKLYFIP